MRNLIYIAVLVVSGVFTSCTDLEEDIVPNQVEQELQNTGGEDQDPPTDPDGD
ncbi:hypothetical protein PG911_07115 [Tenacibaculum ovolyticum]|uniref:hypothetical protein n=1 Tax=Tenacibaculum ovolyticum TaxID=104270 RepID=UPI0022F3DAF9|nr:hypothetical protein [Tenacibaculum ovolyticum]WBX78018.1 hypothetical protein PG911_07115 [Tenacibaculum ovolyticum]